MTGHGKQMDRRAARVLLAKPYSRTSYGYPTTPPLGIGLLGTILRDAGHDVRLLDLRTRGKNNRTFTRLVREFRPDVVCLTVSSFECTSAAELCREAKRVAPGAITIVGGPHPTMSPERTLEERSIDFIGAGEADVTLLEFVNAFPDREAMGAVAGIGRIDTAGAARVNEPPAPVDDLDRLPFVDLGLFAMDAYRVQGRLTLPLFTSRGCPYQCIYCVSHLTQGRKYRTRSPKSLVDEMEQNSVRFKTRRFTILDDTFNLDQQRVTDFCNELMARNLDLQWDCVQGIRADRATSEMFRLMRRAGCRQVAIGIESADDEVLQAMHKGESLDEIRRAIAWANEAGLITKGFFIVGGPGDTAEKVLKSIRFFKDNNIAIPRFSMIMAFPSTPLEAWTRAHARPLHEAYDYVTRHSELAAAGVQFDTADFPARERKRMFKAAEREAEIWLIRNRLRDKFGRPLGSALALPFHFRFSRELLKLAFRLNLLDIYT